MGRTKQTGRKVQIGKYTRESPSGELYRVDCFKGMSGKPKKRNVPEAGSSPVPQPGKKAQRTNTGGGQKQAKRQEAIAYLNYDEVHKHFIQQGHGSGLVLNARLPETNKQTGEDDNIESSLILFEAATVRAEGVKWYMVAKEDGPTVYICKAKVSHHRTNCFVLRKY